MTVQAKSIDSGFGALSPGPSAGSHIERQCPLLILKALCTPLEIHYRVSQENHLHLQHS